ncbi:MAG: hypothetical protein KAQ68_09980 [Clostridiales bacterium]|nr:hypothetical protein [Clostridiales bacterium]
MENNQVQEDNKKLDNIDTEKNKQTQMYFLVAGISLALTLLLLIVYIAVPSIRNNSFVFAGFGGLGVMCLIFCTLGVISRMQNKSITAKAPVEVKVPERKIEGPPNLECKIQLVQNNYTVWLNSSHEYYIMFKETVSFMPTKTMQVHPSDELYEMILMNTGGDDAVNISFRINNVKRHTIAEPEESFTIERDSHKKFLFKVFPTSVDFSAYNLTLRYYDSHMHIKYEQDGTMATEVNDGELGIIPGGSLSKPRNISRNSRPREEY